MLPTRFGNTLRAYEERVHDIRGADPLERFVQKVWHELPTNLRQSHDHLRGRLDLYCTLYVVFVVSGVFAVVTFIGLSVWLLGATAVIALICSWLTYRAATTSARAYGTVLVTIAEMAEPTA